MSSIQVIRASAPILDTNAMAVQPDGKILIAGRGHVVLDGGTRVHNGATVSRLDADGTVDGTFGPASGWSPVAEGFTETGGLGIHAMSVQPDGKILLAGRGFFNGAAHAFLARLTPGGLPDASFGTAGLVAIPIDSETSSSEMALTVQADGRILLAGFEPKRVSVRRFLADGSPDASFASGGAYEAMTGIGKSVRGVHVQADGRVLMAGYTGNPRPAFPNCDPYVPAMARTNSAGVVDGATVGGGLLVASELRAFIWGSRLDAEDRLVLSGTLSFGCTPAAPVVARYTSAGARDMGFGRAGLVTAADLPVAFSQATDVHVQADGKIMVAGQRFGAGAAMGLVRLTGGGVSSPPLRIDDLDHDGIPNALEAPRNLDPTFKDNDLLGITTCCSLRHTLFVMQQFRDFLGREGDGTGINYWVSRLQQPPGTPGSPIPPPVIAPADVVESFVGSPEFQGVIAPVMRLYYAYFRRIPDYDGVQFWIAQHRTGASLEGVSDAFAASAEFQSTYGALDNGQFVTLVFQNILGRDPDAAGHAHWKGQLDSSAITRGQMMLQFSESAEYFELIKNHVYVTMIYMGMLRRGPDEAGYSFWVSYMDDGNSGIALINGFLGSAEYRGRFLP